LTATHETGPRAHTQDLLGRAVLGSDAAWEELYRRYRSFLTWKVRMTMPAAFHHRIDVEDVLQSAFLSAWDRLPDFEYRGEGSLRNWLGRIVGNGVRDRLRHERHEARSELASKQVSGDATSPLPDDRTRSPSQIAALEESKSRVLLALSRLEDPYQTVVGMRVFERLTFVQMAEILECSESRARRLFWDAVGMLQRMVDDPFRVSE
jgi:RNA polymerase sigma-70 factor (ECF subfamily)